MQIADDVLFVLEHQLTYTDRSVMIQGALDRKLYVRVNQVLEACGGTWNRKAKAHLFGSDPRPVLALAIDVGEIVTDRDLGFFATPAPLAEQLVAIAGVTSGDRVLEPSAGKGAIIDAALARGAQVTAIELDASRRGWLVSQTFMLHDWSSVDVRPAQDFMTYEPDEPFDCVVMNPPFARVGAGDHLDHVRHAFGMLISGGTLAAILPSSVEFRQDKRHAQFREAVLARQGEIIRLPDKSFAPATSVNTVMVRMVKP